MINENKNESNELIEKEINKIVQEKENKNQANLDNLLIPFNVPKEEKKKRQDEFDEFFSKLESTDLAVIDESISRCKQLSQYNINITHENLEYILILAFNLGRSNELYGQILSFASYILMTRPLLSDEIVDSEIISQYIQLLKEPMNDAETKFITNFLSSSDNVIKAIDSNFHIISQLVEYLNDPSIPVEDFENLMKIIICITDADKSDIEDTDRSLLFFNEIVKKFIFSDDPIIFGEVCHLYMLILEDSLKNEILNFMNDQPDLDEYLLQRLNDVKHIYKEYILGIFLNFSSAPLEYIQVTYNRGLLDKFISILPILTDESCEIIMLKTVQNFINPEIGIDVALEIASSEFTDVSLRLLHEGSIKAKEAAINYICALSYFSEEPIIQDFIIQNQIGNELIELIAIPSTKVWNSIIRALYRIVDAASASGISEEDLFSHPLLDYIDLNDFYEYLNTIIHDYDNFERTKQDKYKELYQNVIYFVELVEPIIENKD